MRMIRACGEWLDSLVAAWIAVNLPGRTVVAVYNLERRPPTEDVANTIARQFPEGTAEPVGWGTVTAFSLGAEREAEGRNILAAIANAWPTGVGRTQPPYHVDLFDEGRLVDRLYLPKPVLPEDKP